jgi:methionyl-tRNA formyltransferase
MDGAGAVSRTAIFLGSKAFGLTILRGLIAAGPEVAWQVIHPDDAADGRTALDGFRAFCIEHDLGLTLVGKAWEANALIAAARPDFVFVCGWYFLLPADLLTSGPRFLGIHNSLLPKYRGGAPLVWAMINGEAQVGSSLFEFTPGMDDGPVYLQVSTAPGSDDGIGEVIEKIEVEFIAALPRAWPRIAAGVDRGREQDHAAATYCGQRLPEDGGIDWHKSAPRIHDFIRAQSRPYPGAFAKAADRTIHLWRSKLADTPYFGTPGQVLARNAAHVDIACGDGTAIRILQATDSLGNNDLMEIFGSLRMRLGHPGSCGETR